MQFSLSLGLTSQAHNVVTLSFGRRCDVMTSQRHPIDIAVYLVYNIIPFSQDQYLNNSYERYEDDHVGDNRQTIKRVSHQQNGPIGMKHSGGTVFTILL